MNGLINLGAPGLKKVTVESPRPIITSKMGNKVSIISVF